MEFLNLAQINEKYRQELKDAAAEVIDSGCYILGSRVRKFEQEFNQLIGCSNTIGVASGLDALKLILRGYIELGIMQPGDEIILPANTFIATMLAVTENGLTPVICDIDSKTLNLDTSKIEAAVTPKTKGIITVHLYGNVCWDNILIETAKRHGLKIIEDNAQAVGAKAETVGLNGNRNAGNLGDASATSFYPVKNLGALGDGGAVCTNNNELAEVIRALANYGATEKYTHKYKGINSRLDELQAALLSVKLRYLAEENNRRKEIAAIYEEKITAKNIVKPPYSPNCVWHQYVVQTHGRNHLKKHLAEHGVETMIHYPAPLHKHRAYSEYAALELPVAEKFATQILSLPINPAMTVADAETIVKLVNEWERVFNP